MLLKRFLFTLIGVFIGTGAYAADGPCVIPGRGYFRINVGTGGLFGAFAHDHVIEAQKIDGCATLDAKDLAHSSIKLTFPAADIKVIDPKVSAKDRAEVQKTMETEVLAISEHPRIMFESTAIEQDKTPGQLRVRGNLTIRGMTRSVVIPLTFMDMGNSTYRAVGKYSFKQTNFGIKPIRIAGGTVKVKDEVETEFEIFLK
jgi:polyisoprenoid-binding protein YceI